MAKIGRTCKEYVVKELTEKLKDSKNIFVTECTGLTVLELAKLRGNLKTVSAAYTVVKNSLGKLALNNVKATQIAPLIEGSVGLVHGSADPILTSKALLNFSKESGKLKVKGGILSGKIINETDIKALSVLPPKEVLLAMVFGAMQAPISGFVNALNGTINKFVYAINAIKEKKEKEGAK